MLDSKREMIHELTNSAWSILDECHSKYESGMLSLEEAQKSAAERIKNLRYGEENKDYFWITDEHPNMIMHPYRPDLNGTDLSNYSDPAGKKLFVEFTKIVKKTGEGYLNYQWQWKDNATKIVEKLSFVKEFKPWFWIIGTGIYIEDVKNDISNLTNNLIYVSLGILVCLGFVFFYVGKQSFEIEHERQRAEDGLKESESKYRALVEASTDGLVMILDNKIVYINQAILNILGYNSIDEIDSLENLFKLQSESDISGSTFIKDLLENGEFQSRFEGNLVKKDGSDAQVLFNTSVLQLGEKSGFTIIVTDISDSKKIVDELGKNKERFNTLINNINFGVIRLSLNKTINFVEANSAALNILGYQNSIDFYDSTLDELIVNKNDLELFIKKLREKGELKNHTLQVRKKSGELSVISVSAIMVNDEENDQQFCDAVLDDISERIKINEERENLLVELQTSLMFLHQPLENFIRKPLSCSLETSIKKAAQLITHYKYSEILVRKEDGEFIGIVTDSDFRNRVTAENIDVNLPVSRIMSAPLFTVSSHSPLFEAIFKMHEKGVRHLAIKNNEGEIAGVINSEQLQRVEQQSSAYLLREIETANYIEELFHLRNKLPRLIKSLVDSGANSKNITRIITAVFDAIVHKLIEFGFAKVGEPPAQFAFVALGSGGRKEQTLISDQDTAIIFENVPKEKYSETRQYFVKLAEFVCDGLNDCGYDYCPGEAMAKNPKWTQPIDVWKDYFHNWVSNSDQQDLIDVSIYFDFRLVYGSSKLVNELRDSLANSTKNQSGFFQHLTKNCLLHKPPVGLLGGLQLETKGEFAETFNIKMALMPISDFARIYALKYNLSDTNTLERLAKLYEEGILKKSTFDEIIQDYNLLMQIRFRHQTSQFSRNKEMDNFVSPKELTQLELNTLKNAFSQISGLQKRLSYDFSGEAI
ncbi:MAG: hypothetical protein SCALA702_38220 [Melioribacteraceae bacterium]|nr:MAG: hypothetical protein SCALA702_38220 [Melioribacteraceae bacterium]